MAPPVVLILICDRCIRLQIFPGVPEEEVTVPRCRYATSGVNR